MKNVNQMKKQASNLLFAGFLLFLLGLITGLIVPAFANPRLGVSSHIEGVLNGIFLIVLGLVWHKLALSDKALKVTYWLALYGTFANWFGILVAAVFNAGKMLGVMAGGQEGHPVAEAVVAFFLITLSIAMVIISVMVLIGLKKGFNAGNQGESGI
ncbi:MAG TPA: hydrogenase [Prolixibacteraceae bacterium]|nr:hydrogenase [Prolixibacteraceae bacterium]